MNRSGWSLSRAWGALLVGLVIGAGPGCRGLPAQQPDRPVQTKALGPVMAEGFRAERRNGETRITGRLRVKNGFAPPSSARVEIFALAPDGRKDLLAAFQCPAPPSGRAFRGIPAETAFCESITNSVPAGDSLLVLVH